MTLQTVMNAIVFRGDPSGGNWTLHSANPVTPPTAKEKALIKKYITDIYNSSPKAASKLDEWVDASNPIRIGITADVGGKATFGGYDYIGLNIPSISDYVIFDKNGNIVHDDPLILTIHELLHVILQTTDPQYSSFANFDLDQNAASFDYYGDIVRMQNTIAEEIYGAKQHQQSSYLATLPSSDLALLGLKKKFSYTGGEEVDITRLGHSLANNIDMRARAASDDLIMALGGNDTVYAAGGDDFLYGGDGDDTLLSGGDGDDTINGGAGSDTINGGTPLAPASGDGFDTVDYSVRNSSLVASGITLAFSAATPIAAGVNGQTFTVSNDGYGSVDSLTSIEKVAATDSSDTFEFDLAIDPSVSLLIDAVKNAGPVNDGVDFSGSAVGYNLVIDSSGNGQAYAVSGGGMIRFENLHADVSGSAQSDVLSVSSSGSQIFGGGEADIIYSELGGAALISGGDDHDYIVVSCDVEAGGMVIDGGGGNDLIDGMGTINVDGITVRIGTGSGNDYIRSGILGGLEGSVSIVSKIEISGYTSSQCRIVFSQYRQEVDISSGGHEGVPIDPEGLVKLYAREFFIVLPDGSSINAGYIHLNEDQEGNVANGVVYDDLNGAYGLQYAAISRMDLEFSNGLVDVFDLVELEFNDSIGEKLPNRLDAILKSAQTDWQAAFGLDYAAAVTRAVGTRGSEGDDTWIAGTPENNTIHGGGGDDNLHGGGGNDRLIGGYGEDIATYTGASTAFRVTRQIDGTVLVMDLVGGEGTDRLSSIEYFMFDGDSAWYSVEALAGQYGTSESDTWLEGGVRSDNLFGLQGDDTLIGRGGNDIIDGGDGYDQANYVGVSSNFTFSRREDGAVIATDTTTAEGVDELFNVEAVYFDGDSTWASLASVVADYGTAGNDTWLEGTGGSDNLYGLDGDDTLVGREGNDFLYGGEGYDQANYFGSSADFTFEDNGDGTVTVTDITTGEGVDVLDSVEAVYFDGDSTWMSIEDAIAGSSLFARGSGDAGDLSTAQYGGGEMIPNSGNAMHRAGLDVARIWPVAPSNEETAADPPTRTIFKPIDLSVGDRRLVLPQDQDGQAWAARDALWNTDRSAISIRDEPAVAPGVDRDEFVVGGWRVGGGDTAYPGGLVQGPSWNGDIGDNAGSGHDAPFLWPEDGLRLPDLPGLETLTPTSAMEWIL